MCSSVELQLELHQWNSVGEHRVQALPPLSCKTPDSTTVGTRNFDDDVIEDKVEKTKSSTPLRSSDATAGTKTVAVSIPKHDDVEYAKRRKDMIVFVQVMRETAGSPR